MSCYFVIFTTTKIQNNQFEKGKTLQQKTMKLLKSERKRNKFWRESYSKLPKNQKPSDWLNDLKKYGSKGIQKAYCNSLAEFFHFFVIIESVWSFFYESHELTRLRLVVVVLWCISRMPVKTFSIQIHFFANFHNLYTTTQHVIISRKRQYFCFESEVNIKIIIKIAQ